MRHNRGTLHGTLRLHDIADAEAYTRRVLDRTLQKYRQHLDPDRYEDAHQELIAAAWELSLRWQPGRGTTFSQYAGRLLGLRYVDWYRKSTGRSSERPTLIPLDSTEYDQLVDTRPDRSPDLMRAIAEGSRLGIPPAAVSDRAAENRAA